MEFETSMTFGGVRGKGSKGGTLWSRRGRDPDKNGAEMGDPDKET